MIDDWVTARSLGLVVEGKVGPGKIIICGFDLTHAEEDPVSRQMLRSLKDYMDSKKFAPATELTVEEIESLSVPAEAGGQHGVRRITADSEQADYEATNAIDGDPQSMWHSSWEEPVPGYPHYLIVEFEEPEALAGFTALPRQDGNHNGWIKDYLLYVSSDGREWGQAVAQGIFSEDAQLKTIKFAAPITAKFVKLVASSGYVNGPWASLAEFHLIKINEP